MPDYPNFVKRAKGLPKAQGKEAPPLDPTLFRSYVALVYYGGIPMKTVTAREANQGFSRLLGEVAEGEEVVITLRNKPVARMVPFETKADEKREQAIKRMVEMMDKGFHLGGIKVDRDEIYTRGLDAPDD